jgi:aspartate aminotransferase-like enzyme/ribosomal protein S18 acetylase RimI-like enzyme
MIREALEVKIADNEAEFAQIAQLNYATFVEEIPQHQSNPDRALVDKFHAENLYFIAKTGANIVGMLALRNQRPFSLDAKLPNLDDFVEPHESLCEIRLLAIQPTHRHSRVLGALFRALFVHCVAQNFDRALISGRLENIPLYKKLGFKAFAEPVGAEGARYQPMYMTRDTVNRNLRAIPGQDVDDMASVPPTHSFMPGPVALHPSVEAAFRRPAYSHRTPRYAQRLAEVKDSLCALTQTSAVEIFMGTGSLANDVIGAHLVQLGGEGVILSNGEFGERLMRHADGWRLSYTSQQQAWGQALDLNALEALLNANHEIRWLWCVHCETSTGQVNPIAVIQTLCASRGVQVHVDGVSSLGMVACDWRGVRMASSVSGKALGGLTGMAMVFYDPSQLNTGAAQSKVPRYMDLKHYADSKGVPFSGSSPLLEALAATLARHPSGLSTTRHAMGQYLVLRLKELKLPLVLADETRSPGIFTVQLPAQVSSRQLGDALMAQGLECNYATHYLLKRNWLQICLMGEVTLQGLEFLCDQIAIHPGVAQCAAP